MEQVVIKAHAVAKRQQKLHYDEHHIDTTFSPGDHVLRYVHKTDNKLRMHWAGPYKVIKVVNPAVLVIRDARDANATSMTVSVRDLTPTVYPAPGEAPAPAAPPITEEFQQGKMILYRLPGRRRS